jgi:hypothetical protein
MSPPVSPAMAPNRRAWRAANSSVRQAPWEKPSSRTRSGGMPARVSSSSMPASTASPEERPGSFCSTGARKLSGYQVPPAACGAT